MSVSGGHHTAAPRPQGVPELRAVVFAPWGRDAALVERVLDGTACRVVAVTEPRALCDELRTPDVGVVVVTEEGLAHPDVRCISVALDEAPDWSEVPIIAFVDARRSSGDYVALMELLGPRRNVTVLERPIRPVAFRSVVAMAVRGRRQQLRVRDLLERIGTFNAQLQDRVDTQTAALRRRAEEVEALARALTEAESRERERIAQLLHDDLQQLLYGLKIHLEMLARMDGAHANEFERVDEYVDEAISQTRLLTTELHPPTLDGDGVGAALGWVAEFARSRYNLTVHLDVGRDRALSPDVLALATRIARELLLNVVKHAGTMEVWVRVWCDAEACYLRVRDEGYGADPPEGTVLPEDGAGGTGRGLADIQRRIRLAGGWVEVETRPEQGMTVTVCIPARAEGAKEPAPSV